MNIETKYTVTVKTRLAGTNALLEIQRSCKDKTEFQDAVNEIVSLLPNEAKILEHASFSTPSGIMNSTEDIIPKIMTPAISQQPILSQAPQNYSVIDAAFEVLDPRASVWVQTPRTPKEIQAQLTALGIDGVSEDVRITDNALRKLVKSGKIRRTPNKPYKYFRQRG